MGANWAGPSAAFYLKVFACQHQQRWLCRRQLHRLVPVQPHSSGQALYTALYIRPIQANHHDILQHIWDAVLAWQLQLLVQPL